MPLVTMINWYIGIYDKLLHDKNVLCSSESNQLHTKDV